MKTLVALGVLILAFQVLTQETAIDTVNSLLTSLKDQTLENQDSLQKLWTTQQAQKTNTIQSLIQTRQEQVDECARRAKAVAEKDAQVWQTQDFIGWINNRVKANTKRIDLLDELRCQSNQNFIETVKDNKIQLTVSTFLRQQLQRITDENTSYVQKVQAIKQITSFIEKVNDSQYDILNLQRDAEIELDNKITSLLENREKEPMSPIEYKKFSGEKFEILGALDDIEAHVGKQIPLSQQNMIRAGITFISFKEQVNRENDFFVEHLKEQQTNLVQNSPFNSLKENFNDQLVTLKSSAEGCKTRLGEFDTSIQLAQQDLKAAMDAHNAQEQDINDQLTLFLELWNIYQENVVSHANDEVKQQIENAINNNKFVETKVDFSVGQVEEKEKVIVIQDNNDDVSDIIL